MKTLQEMLVARSDDSIQIDVQAGRVRLLLAEKGSHSKLILSVVGNEVSTLYPSDLYKTPNEQADDEAALIRRKMTPDNVQPGDNLAPNAFAIQALAEEHGGLKIVDGKLFAGDIEIPLTSLAGGMAQSQAELATGQTIARPAEAGGTADTGPASTINTTTEPKDGEDTGDLGGKTAADAKLDPSQHSKDDLLALAEKEGVADLKANATKAEIAAAIDAKRAG